MAKTENINTSQLQRLDMLGRLVGGIAHEFNNHLTTILGNAHLLMESDADATRVRRRVSEIRKAAERATRLTRQLLAFSKREVQELAVFDLNETLINAVDLLRPLLAENIEVRVTTASEAALIVGDPSQLEIVIMNLALNARDAMLAGGTLEFRSRGVKQLVPEQDGFTGTEAGDFVELSVRDTGCGMDSATLAQAFDPFFSTKEVGQGVGLGLSTVHGIVRASKGEIKIATKVDVGTVVAMIFPLAAVGAVHDHPQSRPPSEERGCDSILIVETDAEVRRLACRALREHGYRVFEAASGHAGFEMARQHKGAIDLIIADFSAPPENGIEAGRRFCDVAGHAKLLCCTVMQDMSARARSICDRPVVVLHKPYTSEELCKTVEVVLGSSSEWRPESTNRGQTADSYAGVAAGAISEVPPSGKLR